MAPALVLTEEAAAEAGLEGGPFAFGKVFPGVWEIGRPLRISELGLGDEDAVLDAVDEAGVPLELVDVGPSEGWAVRVNHALSTTEAQVADADDDATPARTHAEADAQAAALGVTFPDGTKLADKVAALDEIRSGAPIAETAEAAGEGEGEGEV